MNNLLNNNYNSKSLENVPESNEQHLNLPPVQQHQQEQQHQHHYIEGEEDDVSEGDSLLPKKESEDSVAVYIGGDEQKSRKQTLIWTRSNTTRKFVHEDDGNKNDTSSSSTSKNGNLSRAMIIFSVVNLLIAVGWACAIIYFHKVTQDQESKIKDLKDKLDISSRGQDDEIKQLTTLV